ncbi:outer membrane beta-barrel protein [Pontibacter burrus]|uniref:Porin family protein n=1 Tax=Pontibacter burrus TaxID=2704466 RepID=A0A6B3LK11_9BACT|nr:outer membrane beta-barrel protein [Pontibacter burrus]NEM96293.1 porin family protein [Pontibacter burrus]
MKTLFLFLLLSLSTIAAVAQVNSDSTHKNEQQRRVTIGVNVNTISFHIYYEADKTPGAVRAGYFVPVSLNVGYQLTDRIKLQAGLGLGGDTHEVTEQLQNGEHNYRSRTVAFAVSVSGYLTLLNLYKKLPVYGILAIVPAYGVTTTHVTETDDEGSRNYIIADSGSDVFAIAGLGFNYKVSERIYGNVSYFFYKTNLTGPNSTFYDWDYGYPGARSFIKSLELGMNYRL